MKGVSIRQFRLIVLAILLVNIAAIPLLTKPNVARAQTPITMFIVPENTADLALQAASVFTVDINVTYVEDLYAWQSYVMFNPSILWVTYAWFEGAIPGATPQVRPNNADGWIMIGEFLQGGDPGPNYEGRLCTLQFTVQDYGSTALAFNMTTDPAPVTYITDHLLIDQDLVAVDGYFRNMGPGDANADNTVDIFDIGTISSRWYPGPPVGPAGYHKDADMNLDDSVDIFDIGITSANWGNTYP